MEHSEQFENLAQTMYEQILSNREIAVINAVANGVCEFHTAGFIELINIDENGKLDHTVRVFSMEDLWEKE